MCFQKMGLKGLEASPPHMPFYTLLRGCCLHMQPSFLVIVCIQRWAIINNSSKNRIKFRVRWKTWSSFPDVLTFLYLLFLVCLHSICLSLAHPKWIVTWHFPSVLYASVSVCRIHRVGPWVIMNLIVTSFFPETRKDRGMLYTKGSQLQTSCQVEI